MLATSLQKLPFAEGGQHIAVKVLYVDRGRLAPRNVSYSFKCTRNWYLFIYQIRIKEGIIKYIMEERNGFIFCAFQLH